VKRYWLAVVSLDHAKIGFEARFLQVCHGRAAPLRRAAVDDEVFVYCPRTAYRNGKSLMSVQFHGRFANEKIYQVETVDAFAPFRRDVDFSASFRPIDIRRISDLELTANPSWGVALRRGFLELVSADAARILNRSEAFE
jgi:hypothetical protein